TREDETVVETGEAREPDALDHLPQPLLRPRLQELLQLRRATTAEAPGVLRQLLPGRASDGDELVLEAHLAPVRGDAAPDHAPFGILRGARLAAAGEDREEIGPPGLLRGAEQENGGRTVAGDVGAARVDHRLEVHGGQVLLDELLAELPLHEGVRRDHADAAALAA